MVYRPKVIRNGSGLVRLGEDGSIHLIPNGYLDGTKVVDRTANGILISRDGNLDFLPAGLENRLYEL